MDAIETDVVASSRRYVVQRRYSRLFAFIRGSLDSSTDGFLAWRANLNCLNDGCYVGWRESVFHPWLKVVFESFDSFVVSSVFGSGHRPGWVSSVFYPWLNLPFLYCASIRRCVPRLPRSSG
jgi:hypothetical protein